MSQKTVRRLSIGDELMTADIFLRHEKIYFYLYFLLIHLDMYCQGIYYYINVRNGNTGKLVFSSLVF